MDWDKLRVFHTVAETGSLTSAGKAMNLSQSAVSRQITTLEEDIGTPLFRRHARGLVLTEQGIMLHEATKDMVAGLTKVKGQIMDAQRLPVGPLTITVSEFIAATWLAPKLAEFKERYPQIQLTVIIDDRVLNLNIKEADAAIRLHKPKGTGLVQRHLTSIRFHICGTKKYFAQYGYPKTVEALRNHRLIAFPENIHTSISNPNWLLEAGHVDTRDHQNLLLINSVYAQYAALCQNGGIGVMPDYLIKGNKDLEIVLPDTKRPDIDMYFIYAEERRNSRRINALRDFILENIEATPF
ncbi:MAG: LysR family transcriptional regulator [Alphaproteobacteria bacterium]|nr:LysR family transcriptional regulator [Alphaproteobacteria bacterium]